MALSQQAWEPNNVEKPNSTIGAAAARLVHRRTRSQRPHHTAPGRHARARTHARTHGNGWCRQAAKSGLVDVIKLCLEYGPARTHTHEHARTHTRMHALTHSRTRTHAQAHARTDASARARTGY